MVTILKGEVPEARASLVKPVRYSEGVPVPDHWDFQTVREWLIDAARLWRRSPGGGRSPFATDGPWAQMTRDAAAGDYDARGTDGTSSDVQLGRRSLNTAEVERRDWISEWLAFVPEPADRQLLRLVIGHLANGRTTIPWRLILAELGVMRGKDGMARRYRKAITAICTELNSAGKRK